MVKDENICDLWMHQYGAPDNWQHDKTGNLVELPGIVEASVPMFVGTELPERVPLERGVFVATIPGSSDHSIYL